MKKKLFTFGLCLTAICGTLAYATTLQGINDGAENPATPDEETGETTPNYGVSIGTVEAQPYSDSGLNFNYFYNAEYVAQTSESTYMGFRIESDWVYNEETGEEYEVKYLSLVAINSADTAVTIPDSITVPVRDEYADTLTTETITYPVTQINSTSNLDDGFNNSPIKILTIPASVNYINTRYRFDGNLTALYMLGAVPEIVNNNFQVSQVYVCNKSCIGGYIANSRFPNATVSPYGWDYEWVTVDVAKVGEFAETYLTQNDHDWGAVQYLKVTGNINEIDLNAIKNLTNLIKLDLSETTITAIPNQFMYQRKTLLEVNLPSTVTAIGSQAFESCSKLQSVEADGLKTISNEAFEYCAQLTQINLTGVKAIGSYAFRGCKKLSDIDLSTVETISYYTFYECSALESVDLSSAVRIDNDNYNGHSFASCTSLKNVTLGENLRTLGSSTFYNTAIETITLPESLHELYNSVFQSCKKLTRVELPSTLTSIGSSAFYECTALSQVVMKTGLTSIGSDAFYGCTALEEITIPATVKSIGSNAFNYTGLTDIKCYAAVPPTASSAFIGSGMDMTRTYLYVPPFSKDFYRNTQYWSDIYLMRSIEDQVDYIYVDRPLTINLEEEDNAVVANNPEMFLTWGGRVYNEWGYYEDSRGQLTAKGEGTLSAGQLTINAVLARDSSYRKIPTLINYADKMRADNVTANLYLQNRGYSNGQWHFISLPFDVKVSEIVPSNDTYWVIRRYDGAARAAGETSATWVNLTNDDIMEAGKGYIISAVGGEQEINGYTTPCFAFTSGNSVTKNNLFRPTDIIVPLNEYAAEFAHNRSWNLIGNPYPCYFDMHYLNEEFTAPITVWRNGSYVAYSPVDDNLVLNPFEAFFVQCPLDATEMTFKETGRMHTSWRGSDEDNDEGVESRTRVARMTEERDVFNFEVKGENFADRARIVLNPEARADYEIGRDASKFFAEKSEGAQIYVAASVNYSIDERPVGNGLATLGLRAQKEEKYTLSLSGRYCPEWSVIVTDNVTGKSVDLTREDYTFTSAQGDTANRFAVKFVLKAETDNINTITAAFGQDANVTVTNTGGVTVYTGRLADVNVPAGIYIISNGKETRKAILK